MRCSEELVERHAGGDLEHAAKRLEAGARGCRPSAMPGWNSSAVPPRRGDTCQASVSPSAAPHGVDRGVAHRALPKQPGDVRQQIIRS